MKNTLNSSLRLPIGCLVLALFSGCTIKHGGIVPRSSFIFPNSNVSPLGPTKVSKSKTAFLVSPHWTADDTKAAYNEAVSNVPGANILINYREDTSFSSVFLFNTITYTIDGTAGKMEIGKQILK